MTLTIVPANGQLLEQWRAVHNEIIRTFPLTAPEVDERALRNHLTVAYLDGNLVGNATVRPPEDGGITVIVRILPKYRRQGFGSQYLSVVLQQALLGPVAHIKTVILTENDDGLAFALRRGFVETNRYEVGGAEFVDLTMNVEIAQAFIESRKALDQEPQK